MATWDSIIVGGGIIGLSVAIELRRRGLRVVVLERGEPGQEASHAAAGMLADCGLETPPALQELATVSAHMYPEFVKQLEEESGLKVDYRSDGTLLFPSDEQLKKDPLRFSHNHLPAPLRQLEPALRDYDRPCLFLEESSVDPRALSAAALKVAEKLGVEVIPHSAATIIHAEAGQASGVSTAQTSFIAPVVVNCAGAWAGELGPHRFPTRPVKGQMLAVSAPTRKPLKHVVRAPEAYLVPRSDHRIIIGTTVEEKGFDKKTDVATIDRLLHGATRLAPALGRAKVLEAWAGLRPGTPDGLPILGATPTKGYFVATGHFRDGVLLAPVTAKVMAEVIGGEKTSWDLGAFSAQRFR